MKLNNPNSTVCGITLIVQSSDFSAPTHLRQTKQAISYTYGMNTGQLSIIQITLWIFTHTLFAIFNDILTCP